MIKLKFISILIAVCSWGIFIFIATLIFDAKTLPQNNKLLVVISILAYTVYKVTYEKLKSSQKSETNATSMSNTNSNNKFS